MESGIRRFEVFLYLIAICYVQIDGFAFQSWTVWSHCLSRFAISDGCNGIQNRSRDCVDSNGTVTLQSYCHGDSKEEQNCSLTSVPVNGGWSGWSSWVCIFSTNGTRTRNRTCDNPVTCNNGNDCVGQDSDINAWTHVDGNWGLWERWHSCSVTVGYGTRRRIRTCNNPPPCGGFPCYGEADDYITCQAIPSVFSGPVFGDKYNTINTSLIFYATAYIHIFSSATLSTGNGYREWTLVKLTEDGNETLVHRTNKDVESYAIPPRFLSDGYHKLYLNFSEYLGSDKYVFGWIYLKSIYPPPLTKIKGGSGKVAGHGNITLNARSLSYDLTLGEGHPETLNFSWKCHEFFTKDLNELVSINVNPIYAFKEDNVREEIPWATFNMLKDLSAWARYSTLFSNLLSINDTAIKFNYDPLNKFMREFDMTCNEILNSSPCSSGVNSSCLVSRMGWFACEDKSPSNGICLDEINGQCIKNVKLGPSQTCIEYLQEACTLKSEYSLYMWNISEYDFFITWIKSSFLYDIVDLRHSLQNRIIYLLEGNAAFSNLLNSSFNNATDYISKTLGELDGHLHFLRQQTLRIFRASDRLLFAETNYTLFSELITTKRKESFDFTYPNVLLKFYRSLNIIDSYDMNGIQYETEVTTESYSYLFSSSSCVGFEWNENGYASINMDKSTINQTLGFIVTVKASVINRSSAVSYFQQNLQILIPPATTTTHEENGGIPKLDIECRLNCKQKVASSSVISLRGKCSSCTFDELRNASFSWNMQQIDMFTRLKTDLKNWTNWLETDAASQKFVLRAKSLSPGTSYLISVRMDLENGDTAICMIIIETTLPPYSEETIKCVMSQATNQSVNINLFGWMDEGFRDQRNAAVDWKEQLSFRILQRDMRTNLSTLLYYGSEIQLSGIHLNEGYPEDNYEVDVYIQIFDIFNDYEECVLNKFVVYPRPIDDLSTVVDTIGDAYADGNAKVVSMFTETSANSIVQIDFPHDINNDPSQWNDLGLYAGSNTSYVFEEVLDKINLSINETLKESLTQTLRNYSDVMVNTIKNLEINDIVSLRQAVHAIGTIMNNQNLVDNDILISFIDVSEIAVDMLIKFQVEAKFPVFEEYYGASDDVIRAMDNFLNSFIPWMSPDVPNTYDPYELQRNLAFEEGFTNEESTFTRPEQAFILSLIVEDYIEKLNNSQKMALSKIQQIENTMLKLGVVLDGISYRKQLPIQVEKPGLKSSLHQLNTYGLKKEIMFNSAGIKLEPASDSVQDYSIQMTLFGKTPYIWDEESKFISSDTLVINALNETKAMKTQFRLPHKQTPDSSDVILAFPSDPSESIDQVFFLKVHWKTPYDNLYVNIDALTNQLNHTLYVKKDTNPTNTVFDWSTTISSSMWTGSEFTVKVPGGLYDTSCVVYIAISAKADYTNETVGHHRSKRSTPYNTTVTVKYKLRIWTTGCRVWHSTQQRWDREACSVAPTSSVTETVCDCPMPSGHSFAHTFYVPPNMIDFSSVFYKFDVVSNAAVFGTVIALILVYLLFAVWVRRKDKQDLVKWELTYLSDNLKEDEYLYVLTITTGISLNSGTKSNVMFVLSSDDRDTGVRRLKDDVNKGFETGSVRKIVMSTTKCIGDITYLNIWHDNSGKGNDASWNLKEIEVEDIQTNEKFTFFCNEWLTLDHNDGKIQKIIPVANKSTLSSFWIKFLHRTRKSTADDHLWMSLFWRPLKSDFTRLQRLSCCLVVLFLAMISNAMFFGKNNSIGQIRIGPIKFSMGGLYISVISIAIASPPVIFITVLFKHSRKRNKQNGAEYFECNERERRLPYRFVYVAWLLVLVATLASGFFVILYSMEWGKHKSEEWLKSFFLSWIQSILLIDPVKVIAIAIILAKCMKQNNLNGTMAYERQLLLWETQNRATKTTDTPRKSTYRSFMMNNKETEALRARRKAEITKRQILVELITYISLLTIVYLICTSNRDPISFYSRQNIDNHLLHSVIKNSTKQSIRFDKVQTVNHFYSWIEETLLPFIFPKLSYSGSNLTTYEKGFLQDGANFKVGPLRFRQLRSRGMTCLVRGVVDRTCYCDYDVTDEEDGDYCIGWKPSSSCIDHISYDHISLNAWKYTSSSEIWGAPLTGNVSTYGGGGYIAELGVNLQISQKIVNDLKDNNWIDMQTRAVAVEFTVYNANVNLITYMSLMAEFPEIGGVLKSKFIKIFRIYQHVGHIGVFIFICEIILIFSVAIIGIRMCTDIYRNKCSFFKDTWKSFDFVMLTLTLSAIIMYIARIIFADLTISEFLKNKYKPVNFVHIAIWDEVFMVFAAAIVSLATVRLMRVIHYSERLSEIASVLSHGADDLIGCFVLFFIVLIAYICLGYLVFGQQLKNYRTIFVSFTTIVNALIGRNNIRGLLGAVPIIAQIYYFTFNLIVLWILMTMLNATLNVSITAVRKNKKKYHDKLSRRKGNVFLRNAYREAMVRILALLSLNKTERPKTSPTTQDVEIDIENMNDKK